MNPTNRTTVGRKTKKAATKKKAVGSRKTKAATKKKAAGRKTKKKAVGRRKTKAAAKKKTVGNRKTKAATKKKTIGNKKKKAATKKKAVHGKKKLSVINRQVSRNKSHDYSKSTNEDRVLQSFEAMSTTEFVENVIIPLFVELDYESVEYLGSTQNKSQHLVCRGINRFRDFEIASVQIEKWNPEKYSAKKTPLTEDIFRLMNAAYGSFQRQTGETVADYLYFVTPYSIDKEIIQQFMDQHSDKINTRFGIQIFDGLKVAKLAKENLPVKYSEWSGRNDHIIGSYQTELNNDPLMKALRGKTGRVLKDFYTDIDLAIGRRSDVRFLLNKLSAQSPTLDLSWNRWLDIKELDQRCQNEFGISVVLDDVEQVDREFESQHQEYEAQARIVESARQRWDELKFEYEETFEKLCERFEQHTGYFIADFERIFSSLKKDSDTIRAQIDENLHELKYLEKHRSEAGVPKQIQQLEETQTKKRTELENVLNRIEQLKVNGGDAFFEILRETADCRKKIDSDGIAVKRSQLNRITANVNLLREANLKQKRDVVDLVSLLVPTFKEFAKVQPLQKSLKDRPELSVKLTGTQLCDQIRKKRAQLKRDIKKINEHPSAELLFQMLERFGTFVEFLRFAQGHAEITRILKVRSDKNESAIEQEGFRLTIPISLFFDTKLNFTVLGEAGAGKTTSLMHYYSYGFQEPEFAQQQEENQRLFIPLGRLGKAWHESDAKTKDFQSAFAAYLNQLGISGDRSEKVSLLDDGEERTLLLDGLDEATSLTPWLVTEIADLAKSNPNLQVIVSSRSAEKRIKALPFTMLTLLPFTYEQQVRFFVSWFCTHSNKSKAKKHLNNLVSHVEANEEIRNVVTSPLLATVLCVLEENNVELPSSDIKLFSQRMKLQTGDLDTHRGISRLKSDSETLKTVARAVAFSLHLSGDRAASLSTLHAHGKERTRRRVSASVFDKAMEELVDPCMIIVPMNERGMYGFGHLAFQEFLAAEEVRYFRPMRDLNAKKFLTEVWWQNVCLYLAKLNGEFEWLIDEVRTSDLPAVWQGHLHSMLDVRSQAEQNELRAYIGKKISGGRMIDQIMLDKLDLFQTI